MRRGIHNQRQTIQGDKGNVGALDSQKVSTDVITTSDLKRYKHIVEMTNAHLVGYESGVDIQISSGLKFYEGTLQNVSTEETSRY